MTRKKILLPIITAALMLALTACGAAVPQESSKVPSSAPETAGTEAAQKPSAEESAVRILSISVVNFEACCLPEDRIVIVVSHSLEISVYG